MAVGFEPTPLGGMPWPKPPPIERVLRGRMTPQPRYQRGVRGSAHRAGFEPAILKKLVAPAGFEPAISGL